MPFTMTPESPPRLRLQLLVAALHFLLAILCMKLAHLAGPSYVSPIWAPSGLAVAMLLRHGYRMAPALAVGGLLAMLAMGLPLHLAFLNMAANICEALLARRLFMQRSGAASEPTKLRQTVIYALMAGLLAPVAGAGIGSLGILLQGKGISVTFSAFATWWLGDALGILLVGPFILALIEYRRTPAAKEKELAHLHERAGEAWLLFAGLLLCLALLFSGFIPRDLSHSMVFLLLPFGIWSAMRFGPVVHTGIVLLIAGVATVATLLGIGAFAHGDMLQSLMGLSLFVAVVAFSMLLTAATMADRQSLEDGLRRKESQLRLVVDNFPNGRVAIFDTDKRFILLGGLGLKQLGMTPEQAVGKSYRELFSPEAHEAQEAMLDKTLAGESCYEEIPHADRVYSVRTRPLRDRDGSITSCLVVSQDITKRIDMEEELRRNSTFLQQILDSIPNPVFYKDGEYRYRLLNKAFCEFIGKPPEELRGKTVHEVTTSPLAREYDARDHAMLEGGKRQQYYCNQALTGAGEYRSVCFSKAVVDDPRLEGRGIVGVIHDITDLENAQNALAASERQYRMLFEELGVALVLADAESGMILNANKQAGRLWGKPPDELTGMHQSQLHAEHDKRSHKEDFALQAQSEDPLRREGAITTADGRRVPVEIHSTRLEHQGRPALLGLFLDITERRKLEQLRTDVELMTRHDLKAPLNGIIGLPSVLMQSDNLTPKQHEILRVMHEAGHRMLHLINLSLVLLRIENGEFTPEPEHFDLLPVLQAIRTELYQHIRGNLLELDLVFEDGDEGPFSLFGEELLCYSLFSNLIRNALEASPQKGRVEILLRREEGRGDIAIRNTGAVPQEIRNIFFEKYATAGKRDGTGLGTYSAKLLAGAQGGNVEMRTSDEDDETVVTVTLPA